MNDGWLVIVNMTKFIMGGGRGACCSRVRCGGICGGGGDDSNAGG
jgi:hypothetical protein